MMPPMTAAPAAAPMIIGIMPPDGGSGAVWLASFVERVSSSCAVSASSTEKDGAAVTVMPRTSLALVVLESVPDLRAEIDARTASMPTPLRPGWHEYEYRLVQM